jgi:hypothetical protein
LKKASLAFSDHSYSRAGEYASGMDKKEIESPKLTEHFLFWACGIAVLVIALLAHFVYHIF